MQFASASSKYGDLEAALREIERQLYDQLDQQSAVDVMVAFFSPHFRASAGILAGELRQRFGVRHVLGCSAEGVIAADEEVERQPALAVLAGQLPDVQLAPFALQPDDWRPLLNNLDELRSQLTLPTDTRLVLLIGDPFSTPMSELLEIFNTAYPGIPVAGGMASGGMAPGMNALLLDERIAPAGVIGLAFCGDFDVDLIVSQGCRPIGDPYRVTAAQDNAILTLDAEPALIQLQRVIERLPEDDQHLLRQGLLIGRSINADPDATGRGDYLIRNVMGADRQSGAVVIGDWVERGELVQFHVRDAVTAQEDLELLLTPQTFRPQPSGALLFSCNGRGTRLYDHPNGDVATVQRALGDVPLAGFFCAGEIGPVAQRNFLHGQTVSLAIFRPQRR